MCEFRATIVAVHVGLPQMYFDKGARDNRPAAWRTAFYKSAVAGPVHVGEEGLEGDGVADRANHGGIEAAVLAYSAAHYPHWREELPENDFAFGGFGENLTIDGLSEDDVCIGDRWRSGDVLFEVSKPRQPCWKLNRRWSQPDLAKRVVQTGRGGWYFRIRETGTVAAGARIELEHRPHAEWSVTRVNRLFYGIDRDTDAARELASLPALSLSWREELLNRGV